MGPFVRKGFAILAGLVAAYMALAFAATIDSALGYPRTYSSVAGEWIVRLTSLWPYVVAAMVLGVVVAWIAKPSRRRPWLFVVCVLAAALYASSLRYVAPEWQEWLKTILAAAIVGAAAGCAFWLVTRRANDADRLAELNYRA